MSWGTIVAGAFVSVGAWLLLHMLGLGIGLTAIEPDDPGTLRGVGIGTGIWSLIAPLIALFIGGLVVGRLAGPMHRLRGAIHGAILWSVVTVAVLAILVSAVGRMLSGAVGAGAEMAAGAMRAGSATFESLGLSEDDLVGPINRRLVAEGKPRVTADQLAAATRDVLGRAVAGGNLDREAVVSAIASNTALTRADADEVAGTIERRWNQEYAGRGQQLGQNLQEQALQAAESTGKALIWLFFALLVGLGSAIAGAMLGVLREQQRPTGFPVTRTHSAAA